MKNRTLISIILVATIATPMRAMDVPGARPDESQTTQKELDEELSSWIDEELCFCINEVLNENVEELLEKGANPNGRTQGTTHLMKAAIAGNHSSCVLLIKYGASIDAQDSKGQTALIHCANKFATVPEHWYHGCEQLIGYEESCKLLVDAAAAKAKKQNTLCLLYRLKQMKKEGRPGADVLYKESKDLLRPHLQHAYCKPIELLRIRDNKDQTAYDLLPLPFLDPVSTSPGLPTRLATSGFQPDASLREENNSPIAKLIAGPNQRAALMCKLAFIRMDEQHGMRYFREFFRKK